MIRASTHDVRARFVALNNFEAGPLLATMSLATMLTRQTSRVVLTRGDMAEPVTCLASFRRDTASSCRDGYSSIAAADPRQADPLPA